MRRFARLTHAFSKKIENHAHNVALFATKTRRVTPAMPPGVTDKLWQVVDIVKVLEDWKAAN